MKKTMSILISFLLNFCFAIFELIGGLFSKSVAIMSDALHDAGDALSIGISYFLEKKSEKKPNKYYTYGYKRYSVLGALVTTTILITGSIIVIIASFKRLIHPVEVNYDGMIILAIIGFVINFIAAYITRDKHSLNLRAVNLHMLEDVLGWFVVLVGSLLIKITGINAIDSIMSIGVAIFILVSAIHNFSEIITLFLEKAPKNLDASKIKQIVENIPKVKEIHHIHLWSIDEDNIFATMHIVTNLKDYAKVKEEIKEKLYENGITHVTIELESEKDDCDERICNLKDTHHHHH